MTATKSISAAPVSFARLFVMAAALGLSAGAATPAAAADGPFTRFIGNWSGNGRITVQNGSSERIRCRGRYLDGGASKLSLSLRCASDSYRFDLQSDLTANGNSITGSWNETSRQIFGRLAGQASSNHIDAKVSSVGFDATLSLTTRGNSQNVLIKAPGNQISEVAISLTRSGR